MNKTELSAALAEKCGIDKKEAEQNVNALFGIMTDVLTAHEKVQILGFGTFEVKHRAERQSKNPRTGEPLTIAATDVPVFKAGKTLKDTVAKV